MISRNQQPTTVFVQETARRVPPSAWFLGVLSGAESRSFFWGPDRSQEITGGGGSGASAEISMAQPIITSYLTAPLGENS